MKTFQETTLKHIQLDLSELVQLLKCVKSTDQHSWLGQVNHTTTTLQGKALDVYQRLADDEVDDYDVLKAQLLKRFRLTEGRYRKRFKTGKLEPGETPAQFAERLKRYLEKWPVLSQHMKSYKK